MKNKLQYYLATKAYEYYSLYKSPIAGTVLYIIHDITHDMYNNMSV